MRTESSQTNSLRYNEFISFTPGFNRVIGVRINDNRKKATISIATLQAQFHLNEED